ncbi:hypothetical protein IMW63_01210 [Ehrlichia ruminantium]|uniref:hypothetical protein n=1 Tax=Ehrlichia ruminantium TaxID=779 RepID=UPI001FB4DC6D|nr:hypothetical protein [Ehrlichia ruminantium]UOD98995.1 hypothetical protein IMW63_01210 [Ehrlichia ruminantium]
MLTSGFEDDAKKQHASSIGFKKLQEDQSDNQSSNGDSPIKTIDYDRIFLAISFISLVVEAASSIFNLVSTQVSVADNIKRTLAITFYIIHTILTICAIVNSALAIKQAVDIKRKNKKEMSCNSYEMHSNNLQISENSLTIISQVLWIIVCVSSLVMLYISSNSQLEQALLYISVLAPLLGVLSCVLRLSDSTIRHKNPDSPLDQKRNAKWLSILYGIVLCFEIAHCACHIIEAMSLEGRMQDIYDFSNLPVLAIELATIFAFALALIVEQCLNKPSKQEAEKSNSPVTVPLVEEIETLKPMQHCKSV